MSVCVGITEFRYNEKCARYYLINNIYVKIK